MKVAIIGAGFAGLTCAYELEKYGIKPVLYEKNNFIGEAYEHVTAILEIVHRPIKDIVDYLNQDLGIYLKPVNPVDTLIHNSPNNRAIMKGNFGYFYKRGREKTSVKNQLFSKLKNTKVILNEMADYKKLSKKYDHVVVATGNPNFTEELGCWQEWFVSMEKVAVVTGDFNPKAIVMWINNDYAKNGYVYLVPFNEKKAYIIMVLPCVTEEQIDPYWNVFLNTENIKYKIIEEYNLKHNAGLVYPHRVQNIHFAGAAGGGIDPFLGFGQLNAIKTGIMTARSIVKGKNYEKLIKKVIKNNEYSYEFRKAFNRMSNKDYDLLISLLDLPIIKHLMYNTQINVLKLGGEFLTKLNRRYEIKESHKKSFY